MRAPDPRDLSDAVTSAAITNRAGLIELLRRYGVTRASELHPILQIDFLEELRALPVVTVPPVAEDPAAADYRKSVAWYARLVPSKEHQGCTLENFRTKTPEQKAAHRAVDSWCYCDGKWRNLLLTAQTGTGKTHLACAALHEQFWDIGEGQGNIEFITAADLVRNYRSKAEPETDFFRWYGEKCDLLVIDDIDVFTGSAPTEMFTILLDKRMTNALRTVVTTNSTPGELKDMLGERAYSRLMARCMTVVVKGADYRATM